MTNRKILSCILVIVCAITMVIFTGCSDLADMDKGTMQNPKESSSGGLDAYYEGTITYEDLNYEGAPTLEEIVADLPEYNGSTYVWLNEDRPYFSEDKLTTESFEYYAPLDKLGRCGSCVACVGQELMPTKERESIGMIKPTGWQTVKYEGVSGDYLYNRCHLIAYMLTGENDNNRNLITGTRYMNADGMLPREELVNNYVDRTGNHVLYRVTPVFEGDNLVATGVIMEAKSVEDDGLQFNVFVYNEQPGIEINHANGDSRRVAVPYGEEEEIAESADSDAASNVEADYIANINSMVFHHTWCTGVSTMSEGNKYPYKGTREEMINMGYKPCGNCNP
ncbi:MAG: DNA/RNA non-specific endonuclease [Firmicutes bacterium]|nr:DNA/RNA non-specific endonuclease [Bacillota bacterium]